jgi:ATP-dependent Lon protease
MSFDPFDFKNTLPIINEDSEFFPLMSSEDEEEMNNEEVPDILPILPLRNTVLFPGVVIPITVGRDKSIKLIRDANKGSRLIGVVAQQDVSIEDPTFNQLK